MFLINAATVTGDPNEISSGLPTAEPTSKLVEPEVDSGGPENPYGVANF